MDNIERDIDIDTRPFWLKPFWLKPFWLKPFGPKSRSEGFCLCRTYISGRMAADEGNCVVQVINAFSNENLCMLDLPSSSTVLDIKRHLQASQRISIFCQRLLISRVSSGGPRGLGRPSRPSTSTHHDGVR